MICIDEMGPVSAKTYPGAVWKDANGLRATYDADWGLRGKTWVFGALEPATGQALTLCCPRRDSDGFVQLLEAILRESPAKGWVFIWDNLSAHFSNKSLLALAAYGEKQSVKVLPLPKYAAWLNLIEPWWKQLRSLALKGRRFDNVDDLIVAMGEATDYWNQHARPYLWGKRKKYPLSKK